jgi:hypothetical protein
VNSSQSDLFLSAAIAAAKLSEPQVAVSGKVSSPVATPEVLPDNLIPILPQKHSDAIVRFLRALNRAEEFIQKDHNQAAAIVTRATGLTPRIARAALYDSNMKGLLHRDKCRRRAPPIVGMLA